MPTYQYNCNKCGEGIEFLLKISERDSKEGMICPNCHDGHLSKTVTAPAAFSEGYKMGLGGKHDGLKNRLQEIHRRTPGSILDKTSTINKI